MTVIDPLTSEPRNIGKILCIGRNYARHAAEMNDSVPMRPVIFLKPTTSLIRSGGSIVLPKMSSDVHHEVELVAMIGRTGHNIPEETSLAYVAGYALGLDMTARDLQAEAKTRGNPWSVAKGFDTFAPLGEFVPANEIADPQDLTLSCLVNGEKRQHGHTKDMIFTVSYLIAYCSRIFTLERGDLLYTGTPEGVGPVFHGDGLEARSHQLPTLAVTVR